MSVYMSLFIIQVALCHFLVNKGEKKLCFNSELRSMAHVDMRGDSISQYWMLDGHATWHCHDKCFMTASYYHTGTWLHQAFSVLSVFKRDQHGN